MLLFCGACLQELVEVVGYVFVVNIMCSVCDVATLHGLLHGHVDEQWLGCLSARLGYLSRQHASLCEKNELWL